ncbi:MOSC N-terminal beta barrel domain-containing protein [Hydrogenivirga sp. 128-5-R1-1]|uniref:MOSC domain-containing protein n=1 Tax=Hydrogenivirga sp. 128-5-R1-1 TaxID=392423 RepID=UPI00015F3677|nr:MOSC N-terminal beta barrel domain-containing protein [Hydrogenivirga sp. 128-5-R1-1]EDP76471.1 MOSC [Hydrogenivirga sp. 128-5-R1-1]
MSKPVLSRILLYPIKGLDPVEVKCARLTPSGSLLHDREFALFDEEGNVVSGKREKKIHRIRSEIDLDTGVALFRYEGKSYEFTLEEVKAIEDFFSEVFGYRVYLRRSTEGFPDDRKAHGPTIVSRATLREVGRWFGLEEENVRRRFRANLEIEGVPPFWEDSLVGEDSPKKFYIGEVIFSGEGISKRCPVPTRDPYTGEELRGFVKKFIEKRKETLPPWSPRGRFEDTFYRLCLNTSVLKGEELSVGDELTPLP